MKGNKKWYTTTIKYTALIEDVSKEITEVYLFRAVSHGDVEAQVIPALATRMKMHEADPIAQLKVSGVFYREDPEGKDSFFYLATIKRETIDDKKVTEKYLFNALNPRNALDRITSFMKGTIGEWEVEKIEKTKYLGVYDLDNKNFLDDFAARQEDLLAERKYEYGMKPDATPLKDDTLFPGYTNGKPAEESAEPAAPVSTELAIKNDVVSVDAEDLNNGVHEAVFHSETKFENINLPMPKPNLLPGGVDSGTDEGSTDADDTTEIIDDDSPADIDQVDIIGE